MKKLTFKTILGAFLLSAFLFSCEKEKDSVDINMNDEEIASIEDNAQSDESVSDLFIDVHAFSSLNDDDFSDDVELDFDGEINSSLKPIITIAPMGNAWPKTVTFDFGAGVTKNGITRKGKIVALYSNRLKKPNARVDVTFVNFYINGIKIDGTTSVVNNGKNANGNLTFTVTSNQNRILLNKGLLVHSASRNIEWIKGDDSDLLIDDEFRITGNGTGINFKNKNYTTNIVKPLIKKIGCPYIVEGTIEISLKDKLKKTLDYGNGVCDNEASVIINGNTKIITLKK